MAATASIPMKQNNLSEITELVSLFKSLPTLTEGSNVRTTGPSTTTTKSDITSEGMQAMLNSILSGTSGIQGLAQLSQGQKVAGLYNSTVNQQIVNDLLTRASGEVAQKSAGQTTTQSGNTVVDQSKQSVAKMPPLTGQTIAQSVLGLGAGQLAKKGYKTLEEILAGNAVEGGGFTGASSVPIDAATTAFASAPVSAGITAETAALLTSGELGAIGAGLPVVDAAIAGVAGEAAFASSVAEAQALGGLTAAEVGVGTAAGEAALGGISAETAAALGMGELGAIGGGAAIEGAVASEFGAAIGGAAAGAGAGAFAGIAGAELAAGSGLGALAGAELAAGAGAGAGIGEILAAIILWVICTELHTQGRMPTKYYIPGARWFAKYPSDKKVGYYIWAIPAVKHLRKHPYSPLSKFLCYVFNARAEMIAYRAGIRGARNNVVGRVTEFILYPACYTLGTIINALGVSAKFDPAQLYAKGGV